MFLRIPSIKTIITLPTRSNLSDYIYLYFHLYLYAKQYIFIIYLDVIIIIYIQMIKKAQESFSIIVIHAVSATQSISLKKKFGNTYNNINTYLEW